MWINNYYYKPTWRTDFFFILFAFILLTPDNKSLYEYNTNCPEKFNELIII